MHEFSLYGQVSNDGHHRVIQQLAGYTRMQPQATQEIHVVFRARAPAGLDKIPSAGGSQGVMQQEAQKYRNMLSASLYYVQLVGEVSSSMHITPRGKRGDVEMRDDPVQAKPGQKVIKWSLDFRDTPDPGKQVVSTRLVFKTPVEEGDLATFMDHFGYEYVSRYMVKGTKFYDRDTTIHVHKVLRLPPVGASNAVTDTSFLTHVDGLKELDGSGAYIVQASIDAVDGNNPELKDRATRQLLNLKEALRQAVSLTPGDRLALDTRVPLPPRRS